MSQRYAGVLFGLLLQLIATSASAACLNASPGANQWQNLAFSQPQTGIFVATAEVTAPQAGGDVILAVTQGPQTFWSGLTTSVRFHTNNMIDVVKGDTYGADVAMPYRPLLTYRIRMEINIPAHTYSVYVAPTGRYEQRLAKDYPFRAGHENVTSLDNWTLEAEIGSSSACNFAVDDKDWTSARFISNTATNYRVAMGGNGSTIAVWDATNTVDYTSAVWAAVYTHDGGWSAPQRLDAGVPTGDSATTVERPDVAMDGAGNGMAVWSEYFNGQMHIKLSRYTAGVGWSAPERISRTVFPGGPPRIAMSPNGEAVVVWDHDGGSSKVATNRYVPGRGWLGEQEPFVGESYQPQVAMDDNGRATALFFKGGNAPGFSASHLE